MVTRHTADVAVQLSNRSRIETARFTLEELTDTVRVRIRRPTTAGPAVTWEAGTTLRVAVRVRLGTREQFAEGTASGGVREFLHHKTGLPIVLDAYELRFSLPEGFFAATDTYARRWGQLSRDPLTAQVEIEHLRGPAVDTVLEWVESTDAPAPTRTRHNSVAFGNQTRAIEAGGDAVITVSHTATGGSDRAIFAGTGSYDGGGAAPAVTSLDYGGVAMTEMWDITDGVDLDVRNAGYQLAGDGNVSTSSQTVTATHAGTPGTAKSLNVISLTGVDSATPVGTPVTGGDDTNASTLTVASVGADDLVVDYILGPSPVEGADQTEPAAPEAVGGGVSHTASYQAGTVSPADMSWSMGFLVWAHGAVNFKASTGPPPAASLKITDVGLRPAAFSPGLGR